MNMLVALSIWMVLGGYALIGLVFGVWFVCVGANRLDQQASTMPLRVRVLILPGSLALWPLLIARLAQPANREPS